MTDTKQQPAKKKNTYFVCGNPNGNLAFQKEIEADYLLINDESIILINNPNNSEREIVSIFPKNITSIHKINP